MSPTKLSTSVLTIRVPPSLGRRLAAEARRRQQTRSEAARALLEAALADAPDPTTEARRQSRLASRQDADRDMLDFITAAADAKGWR